MSGYILCQTKKAGKPYFVENISTNIYSLEELCYYLYHNLYLVDSSVMNEGLCIWISEELDLPRLAAKLRPHLGKFASIEDVLYPIFKEINYLTYDELKALNVKLAKLDQEAPLLRQKQKGDALVAKFGMCVQLSFPDGEGIGMLLGGIPYREQRQGTDLLPACVQKRKEAGGV